MIDPLRATGANRGRIAFALLVVSGSLWLCFLVALIFLNGFMASASFGLDPAVVNAVSNFIGFLLGMIPTVATVVILCRGYILH